MNQQAPLEPTGNTPFAGAVLAAAFLPGEVSILDQDPSDLLGDVALAESIASRGCGRIGFSLYCWNVERSLRLAVELRKRLPGVELLAGGPEVTGDNLWLLESDVFDLLFCGEGEPAAQRLLGSTHLPEPEEGRILIQESSEQPPGTWPDPYLSGVLDPARGDPVMVETVRGCSSTCGYCAYRKSHPVPRVLPAGDALRLLGRLSDSGAEEVVFLDPTFNSRPDLEILLKGMRDIQLKCFGEMRGELLTHELATAVSRAGFHTVEIGLQSLDSNVLALSGRFGDPMAVLRGASMLKSEGVTPVLDLMLGLPGDNPDGAVRAAEVIRELELHENVQVFHVALLPGTGSVELDRESMRRPPYYRFSPPVMNGWAEARERMADVLGYDLDMAPRPLLFDGWPGTVLLDLDAGDTVPLPGIPSIRHGVLRVRSKDLWSRREKIYSMIRTRLAEEPHCILDVVLEAGGPFPVDLISTLRRLSEPRDYSDRTALALGRDGNLRISVLVRQADLLPMEWLMAIAAECPLVLDADHPGRLQYALLEAGAGVRLPGEKYDLGLLERSIPSLHQLYFSSRVMEERWSAAILCSPGD